MELVREGKRNNLFVAHTSSQEKACPHMAWARWLHVTMWLTKLNISIRVFNYVGFAPHLLLYVAPFFGAWLGCMACAPMVNLMACAGAHMACASAPGTHAWHLGGVAGSKCHGKRQWFGSMAGSLCCCGRCPSICPSMCTRQPTSVCPSVRGDVVFATTET